MLVWFQLVLVTATMALLETTNKPLAVISILAAVSILLFGLYELFRWYGTAPFLAIVALLAAAMYRTIAYIDKMDAFAAEFKTADKELELDELYAEEQREKKEVGCFCSFGMEVLNILPFRFAHVNSGCLVHLLRHLMRYSSGG